MEGRARSRPGWTGQPLALRPPYMVNELELPSEGVAIALGHTDGGELVRKLYGIAIANGPSIA